MAPWSLQVSAAPHAGQIGGRQSPSRMHDLPAVTEHLPFPTVCHLVPPSLDRTGSGPGLLVMNIVIASPRSMIAAPPSPQHGMLVHPRAPSHRIPLLSWAPPMTLPVSGEEAID